MKQLLVPHVRRDTDSCLESFSEAKVPGRVTLSVLIPVYNEAEFAGAILERVKNAPLPANVQLQIIVVDDASTDESLEIIEYFAQEHRGLIHFIRHSRNRGKGAAIRTALDAASGELAIIQDADLEYDPREYSKLLAPLLDDRADAVFGSRFLVAGERRVLYFWHAVANWLLTSLCNIVSDLNLTDMETCYKAFRVSLVKSIPLRCDRFGIEPELTIKLSRRQARIYEVPISYSGRTYEEGKKIGLWDAAKAVLVILRFALLNDSYKEPGAKILDAFAEAPRFNRWMADTIRPYLGQRVMEVGAGMGNLSRLLSPRRKRYIATDIDDEHMARLRTRLQQRPNLEVRRCDLACAADFEPVRESVDTVICLNVLEHIGDDMVGLSNIHSCLSRGGKAIILVPQDMSLYGTLDEILGHFRRYTPAELRGKMEAAGFRVEEILEFNRVSRPAWYISGRILKRTAISRLQMRLFDRMVWLWRRIDSWLPWKSVSIIAIGTKK